MYVEGAGTGVERGEGQAETGQKKISGRQFISRYRLPRETKDIVVTS
jgi:hypothetical protein